MEKSAAAHSAAADFLKKMEKNKDVKCHTLTFGSMKRVLMIAVAA
jgi:hypothetical protein